MLIIKRKSKLQLLCAAVVSFSLINVLDIHVAANGNQVKLNIGQAAEARRSGGRSGGGSFRSSPSRSSPSRSRRFSDSDYSGGRYSTGRSVYVGSGSSYYYSPMPVIVLIIILGILAIAIILAIRSYINSTNSGNPVISNSEIENDIVTISKIQVGLLAQARTIQTQLSEYSLNTDTETSEGLAQLLQEAALALLRTAENWMHVSASSKTVRSL